MTALTIDVISEITSLLQNNLTDPNDRRSNDDKRFVYDHFPNLKGQSMPRIGVTRADTSYEFVGINAGVEAYEEVDILLNVVVKDGQDFTLPPYTGAKPSEYVLSWMARNARKLVKDNQSNFTSLSGVKYVAPHPDLTSLPQRTPEKNFTLEQVPLIARIRPT